ncbi:unnamed protein product [Mytilus coruscus]|uniref:Uncharacterized protein n=1 Tax=Mytilus coruscus TaxID=42192 RepID=A0A6J8A177_MYTCO|nr:unnamed protein product [Mytilus coruscus]
MRTIKLLSFFLVYIETTFALYIRNENNEHTDQNSMFPRNDEARLSTNSDTSGIRIHINANGGRDTPFIVLRRKPNSNMRLRINKDMNSNAPLRIVYAGNEHSNSDSNGPFHPQHTSSRQRIVFRSPEVNENPTMVYARNQQSISDSTGPFDQPHATSRQRIVFRPSEVNENPTGVYDNQQRVSDSARHFDEPHAPSRQRIVFTQSEVNENPTGVYSRNQQSISDSTGLFDQPHAPSRPRIVFRQSEVNGNPSRIILKSANQSRVRISSRNFKQTRSRH